MKQSFAAQAAFALLISFSLGIAGCGEDDAASSSTPGGGGAAEKAGKGADSPEAVVQMFLNAIQKGDKESAQQLLTSKAIAAIEQQDVEFLPEAIAGASFRVGQTVKSGNNYFVQCIFSSQDTDGSVSSENLQWLVKQEDSARWGIFGMAIHEEGSGPLVVNFERDPFLAQQGSGPQQQAANPGASAGGPPQQAAIRKDPFQTPPQ